MLRRCATLDLMGTRAWPSASPTPSASSKKYWNSTGAAFGVRNASGDAQKTAAASEKSKGGGERGKVQSAAGKKGFWRSTTPAVPESSLTSVLRWPEDAYLHKSDGMWSFHLSMAVPILRPHPARRYIGNALEPRSLPMHLHENVGSALACSFWPSG